MLSIQPLVSVLMPVYNGELFVDEAIQSILTQTFTNFEFIIVNDGSTDKSLSIIKSFEDQRIKIINNLVNKGLVYSLNKGIDTVQGKYIARMDADDIAQVNRLEQQVLFLEQNPDIVMVGTGIRHLFGQQKISRPAYFPNTPKAAQCRLLFNTTFIHPSILISTAVMKSYYYDPAFFPAEDYDLWARIAFHHKMTNLQAVHLHYRLHQNNIHLNTRNKALIPVSKIYQRNFNHLFKYHLSEKELELHLLFCLYSRDFKKYGIKEIRIWINTLLRLNKQHNTFSEAVFKQQLALIWSNYINAYMRHHSKSISIIHYDLIWFIPLTAFLRYIIYWVSNFSHKYHG